MICTDSLQICPELSGLTRVSSRYSLSFTPQYFIQRGLCLDRQKPKGYDLTVICHDCDLFGFHNIARLKLRTNSLTDYPSLASLDMWIHLLLSTARPCMAFPHVSTSDTTTNLHSFLLSRQDFHENHKLWARSLNHTTRIPTAQIEIFTSNTAHVRRFIHYLLRPGDAYMRQWIGSSLAVQWHFACQLLLSRS